MIITPNWYPDTNRFHLAGPPAWWLRRLWDFDNSLAVIPSRQDCVYRLGQRRKLNLANNITNDALFDSSDTKMMARYSLVPVTTILATANWSNPYLFVELANRAPWRLGGAERVIKSIEETEQEEEAKKNALTAAKLHERAKDGWKVYQNLTGARSFIDASKQSAWNR